MTRRHPRLLDAIAGIVLLSFCNSLMFGQYISSQIWTTSDAVYASSTSTYNGALVSVQSDLWRSGIYSSAQACQMHTATATTSLPRMADLYIVVGSHSFDPWTLNQCYQWYSPYQFWDIPYSYVELDLRLPVINYFYANPSHTTPPGTVTLYYGTSLGTSLNINGTAVSPGNGSLVVSPAVTTTYTLTVTNTGGTVQTSVIVWVDPPPNPLYYRYSVRHEKGASPFFPMLPLEGETVNSANGNLLFQVPLLSRPGRNGLGVDLSLLVPVRKGAISAGIDGYQFEKSICEDAVKKLYRKFYI